MKYDLSDTDLDTLRELAFRAKNDAEKKRYKTDKTTNKDSIAKLLKLDLITSADNGVFLVYRPNLNGYNVLESKK